MEQCRYTKDHNHDLQVFSENDTRRQCVFPNVRYTSHEQSRVPVTVKSRVFKNRYKSRSPTTTCHKYATTLTNDHANILQSVTGVVDCLPATHNGGPTYVGDECNECCTLDGYHGIVISKSVTPTVNNGGSGFDNSMAIKSDSVLWSGDNNNKPVKKCDGIQNNTDSVVCQDTMKLNEVNSCPRHVNEENYGLLYDVNANQ